MRLLIVGTLKGQLTTATKIAMDNGASVTHAETTEQAMAVLRGGKGADLMLVDVALDIRDLVLRLEAEHIHVPIVACGTSNDARAAVAAIHAGAKEYIPLPPDPELIAAVLAAVTDDRRELVYRDESMAHVVKLAQQQVRGGDRRHAAARRNLGNGHPPAGQAAARHTGAGDRPRRRHPAGARRHPHHCDLQPQLGRGGARRQLPRGPAVPPQRGEP